MKSQKGFSAVEALLVVLVLCILGFGGYFVWNSSRKDGESTSKSTTSQNQSGESSRESSAIYTVEIPALGIKLNDPEKRGFTLKKLDVESPIDGSISTYYTLTPRAYAESGYDKNCESIGYVHEVDRETADSFSSSTSAVKVKNIDGKYYTIAGTIGGCGDGKAGWQEFVTDTTNYIYNNLQKL